MPSPGTRRALSSSAGAYGFVTGLQGVNAAKYADLAAFADFNEGVYALPALGGEMVSNGGFDDTSVWALSVAGGTSTAVISGGVLTLTGDGTNQARADQSFGTVAGKTYALSASVATNSATLSVGTTQGGTTILNAATLGVGTPVAYFTASAPTTWVRLGRTTAGATVLDTVSVKEVVLDRPDQGTELIQSGDFSSSTGWTLVNGGTGTATISGGTLNLTGDGAANSYGEQAISGLAIGVRYRVFFVTASNAVGFRAGTTSGGTDVIADIGLPTGLATFFFTPTTATVYLRWRRSATGTATVDNVSVKDTGTAALPKRPATFAEWFAFTAASTTARTYTGQDGTLKNDLAVDAPRADYLNGKRQLRLENASTNLVLNSATLATQNVTVTAQSYTLSFYGTGTVTLSGTSTAGPLVGTGANNRVTLTFTPTAGTLTLTVSGSVTSAQLEAGSFASNYIPTTGAAVTRAIETCSLSALLLALGQRGAGTWVVRGQLSNTAALARRLIGSDTTGAPILAPSGTTTVGTSNASVTLSATLGSGSTSSAFGASMAFDGSGRALAGNGGTVASDTNQPNARVASYLGRSATVDATNAYGDGYYDFVGWSPERAVNTTLQALAVAA